MASTVSTRRLSSDTISQDIDSLNGLGCIQDYQTVRPEASSEALQQAYQTMLAKQQLEVEKQMQYKAAVDAARQAEWEFHNSVLAMKEVVRGQYGSDSNEAQAIGLKKKSERRRPARKAVAAS